MANKPAYEQLEQQVKKLEKVYNKLQMRFEQRTAQLLEIDREVKAIV